MKKIPTLFEKDASGARVTRVVRPGFEWVTFGEGVATEKVDGAACAIIKGKFYKRYDANVKKGRTPPKGGIPCDPWPDPVTGHWPFWVEVNPEKKEDRWFVAAYENTPWNREDGTYEAVGVHFQGNPYKLDEDFLEKHGRIKLKGFPRTYDGIKAALEVNKIEGCVFWKDGEPKCKIRRKDFGLEWPVKGEKE